jgi:hypothetical protein
MNGATVRPIEAGIAIRETRGTYSYFSLVPGALDSVREVFSVPEHVAVPTGDGEPAACC